MGHEGRRHEEHSLEAMIIAAIGAVIFILYKIITEPRKGKHE